MPSTPSSPSATRAPATTLLRAGFACLVALAVVSVALVFVGPGAPRGVGLALVKVVLLAFVASRAWRADVYALQWSSMLILLFVAEGVVRAMTDPWPASLAGGLAALCGGGYFGAVLAYLRPLKKAARDVAHEATR